MPGGQVGPRSNSRRRDSRDEDWRVGAALGQFPLQLGAKKKALGLLLNETDIGGATKIASSGASTPCHDDIRCREPGGSGPNTA
jgi:hypothetical protein